MELTTDHEITPKNMPAAIAMGRTLAILKSRGDLPQMLEDSIHVSSKSPNELKVDIRNSSIVLKNTDTGYYLNFSDAADFMKEGISFDKGNLKTTNKELHVSSEEGMLHSLNAILSRMMLIAKMQLFMEKGLDQALSQSASNLRKQVPADLLERSDAVPRISTDTLNIIPVSVVTSPIQGTILTKTPQEIFLATGSPNTVLHIRASNSASAKVGEQIRVSPTEKGLQVIEADPERYEPGFTGRNTNLRKNTPAIETAFLVKIFHEKDVPGKPIAKALEKDMGR